MLIITHLMDNIFFVLSKLLWLLIRPENLIIIALAIVILLFFLKKDELAKKYLYITSTMIFFIAIFPIGSWLLYPLETHFPTKPDLPKQVDGIILLGGSFLPSNSEAWNKVQTNSFADRIHDFLALIHRYPNAKAIFTGGSASVLNAHQTEAYFAEKLFTNIGIKKGRIEFEDRARNTYENILYSKKIAQPQANETWVVITTAFHLPRTIGIFCQQQWPVIPYPADFHTNPKGLFSLTLNLSAHLNTLNYAIHEWIGLVAYFLTGKTTSLLPNQCLKTD